MQSLVNAARSGSLARSLGGGYSHQSGSSHTPESVRALQQTIQDEMSELEDVKPREKKGRSATITRGYILGFFVYSFHVFVCGRGGHGRAWAAVIYGHGRRRANAGGYGRVRVQGWHTAVMGTGGRMRTMAATNEHANNVCERPSRVQ